MQGHGQIGPSTWRTETEVACVAPKSGGTDTHGQIGPPNSPQRRRLHAWHQSLAPLTRMAKLAPQIFHKEGGCVCGTEVQWHKHAWPNRPPPSNSPQRRLRTWHQSPAPKIRIAKSAPPSNPQRRRLHMWHQSTVAQTCMAK